MSDEDLRVLARLAETDGGAAVLRYSQALERAGRRSEALGALSAGRDHPDVLAEIRRRAGPLRARPYGPTWSAWSAPTRPPAIRKRELAVEATFEIEAFLGNPFGIVLVVRSKTDGWMWWEYVLDPDTGDFRGSVRPFGAHSVELAIVEDAALYRTLQSVNPSATRVGSQDLITAATLWEVRGSQNALVAALDAPRTPPAESPPDPRGGTRLAWYSPRFVWQVGAGGVGSTLEVGADP